MCSIYLIVSPKRKQYMPFGRWLATFVLMIPVAGWQTPADPEAAWQTDYAKALAEARQTGKPIFAVFT
jgi:hypothetical protein